MTNLSVSKDKEIISLLETEIDAPNLAQEEDSSQLRELEAAAEAARAQRQLEIKEKADILGMRQTWSNYILLAICLLTCANLLFCLSAIFYHNHNLYHVQYSDSVLITLLTSGACEMFGLAFIVARFLFSSTGDKTTT